jgi:hypothetical protein
MKMTMGMHAAFQQLNNTPTAPAYMKMTMDMHAAFTQLHNTLPPQPA